MIRNSSTEQVKNDEWMNELYCKKTIKQYNLIVLTYNCIFCKRQTLKQPRLHLIEAAQILYNLLIPDNRYKIKVSKTDRREKK